MAKAKILIVEDEKITAMDIQNILETLGYEVPAIVCSGEDAIEKAAKLSPDLVLMDIVLKRDMDGIEAAEEIRNRFNVPIVYLSAYGNEETLQRAKITEPFGYILKPLEERALQTTIEIALYRHRTESKLKESEAKYRTLFDASPEAVVLIGLDGTILDCNDAIEKIGGMQKEEFIGKPFMELKLFDEETLSNLIELFPGVIKGEVSDPVDLVVQSGSEKRWIEFFPALLKKGDEVQALQLIIRDITKRKEAEEEIQQQKTFLETILESLTHPFYVIDADDYTVKMANSAAKFEGLPEENTCYALTHQRNEPCDGTEHLCPIEEVKKTKKPAVVEHVHYDKDGNAKNFEVHAHPIFDSKGNIVQILEYSLDITERKLAEEKLHKTMTDLERFNRLAVGRELQMIELKREVNYLLHSIGRREKYKIHTSRNVKNKKGG